jgi:hypothetical protein
MYPPNSANIYGERQGAQALRSEIMSFVNRNAAHVLPMKDKVSGRLERASRRQPLAPLILSYSSTAANSDFATMRMNHFRVALYETSTQLQLFVEQLNQISYS